MSQRGRKVADFSSHVSSFAVPLPRGISEGRLMLVTISGVDQPHHTGMDVPQLSMVGRSVSEPFGHARLLHIFKSHPTSHLGI